MNPLYNAPILIKMGEKELGSRISHGHSPVLDARVSSMGARGTWLQKGVIRREREVDLRRKHVQ
jgi:hypothetical protein